MPKHTWTISVKSDAGVGPSTPLPIYFPQEQNIGGSAAGETGLQIGVNDVEEVDNLNIDVSALVSFFMKCDYDVEVRTNSWLSPSQTLTFQATAGMAWNNSGFPLSVTNPLTVDITKLFVKNLGTKNGVAPTTPGTATFNAGFGQDDEVTFS